jgi:hypothetical protein
MPRGSAGAPFCKTAIPIYEGKLKGCWRRIRARGFWTPAAELPEQSTLTELDLDGQTISHYRIVEKLGVVGWVWSSRPKTPAWGASPP